MSLFLPLWYGIQIAFFLLRHRIVMCGLFEYSVFFHITSKTTSTLIKFNWIVILHYRISDILNILIFVANVGSCRRTFFTSEPVSAWILLQRFFPCSSSYLISHKNVEVSNRSFGAGLVPSRHTTDILSWTATISHQILSFCSCTEGNFLLFSF